MIILNPTQTDKIREYTLFCYPREMCGILTEEDFHPLTNIAENPETSFSIDPKNLIPFLGKIKAVVHSHTKDPRKVSLFDLRTPSIEDINAQKLANVPFLIVGTEGQNVLPALEIPREKTNNYIGRPFIWFIYDCYTLVQDYYLFDLGISLPDHKADKDYKELKDFDNVFAPYISEYGFIEKNDLEGLKNGDLFLLDNAGVQKNHLGIYHNGKVLHQDMISCEVPFEYFLGRIQKRLVYVGNSI